MPDALTDQITNYLGQTNETNVVLRSQLASKGYVIVANAFMAAEPMIIKRAKLAHAPIANLNPEGYVKLASESVQAVLQNLMDLIRQTGHGTEAGLIGILNQSPSLCMRVPAALFLGLPEVRTDDSVPWLKKILSNNSEHPLLKIAAARSLLNNDNAEEETWNRAMQFLKSWADATYPSWESVTKRAGINNAQDALSMLAQREIPSALVLMFS